jgi:putative thiamine transport system permease protein
LKYGLAALLLAIWGLPFGAALIQLLASALDVEAWRALALLPHKLPQLALSLFIGGVSTLISVVLSALLAVSPGPRRQLQGWLGGFLSLPHVAFAAGFAFLIMPAGLLARLLGFQSPPQWVTTQDPYGLSLIAALVLKEVPFLLFLMLAVLSRADLASALKGQSRAAASLGHGSRSIAFRIVLPQLLRQLIWPIIVVWTYGSTVIDMAIVIGPTQPAPFQIAVWRDLADADAAINARGLAGALLLVITLAAAASVIGLGLYLARPELRRFLARGPERSALRDWPGWLIAVSIGVNYALVLAVLALVAASTRWPFPLLLPEQWDEGALLSLVNAPAALVNSLVLAGTSALLALLLTITWFEQMPRRADRWMMMAVLLALVLPPVAIASGQYSAFLRAGIGTGTIAVFLAQFTPVFAYVFIALRGPMREFDPRYRAVAASLRAGHVRFLLRVKAPLLAGPLAAAAAIGFAVSIGQYVPVQLLGGGTVPTLATEAVTLASGGSRSLLAAHALALMALPAFAFMLASFAAWRHHA